MQLPQELQAFIDRLLEKAPPSLLKRAREALSATYREESDSHTIFSDESKRLAYLATRFPATYSAVHKVLTELQARIPSFSCQSFVDLGAGPGTAFWAALDLFPTIQSARLIEKNREAVSLGKEISSHLSCGRKEEWLLQDLETIEVFPQADLAVGSYSMGELKNREEVLLRLWHSPIETVVLIEPGTPRGFSVIRSFRETLIKAGAFLIAPCPHHQPCPLFGSDWCHFPVRVERSSRHRLLKEGSLGYEDEKFSYLIASKKSFDRPSFSRVLRHPQKGSGHVRLSLCTPEGEKKEAVFSKKMKEIYKKARDADWGDSI